jgi:DNA-directed RNA polymerase subunit RPC12/RpoP
MIRFACAQCGAKLAVAEEKAGWKGKCPKCGGGVVVPAARMRWVAESSDGQTEQVLPPPIPKPREQVAPPAPKPAPSRETDDSCPRCKGTRIVEEPQSDVRPIVLGGMLFGVLGAVAGGVMGALRKPHFRCLDCGCEWTVVPE